MGPENPGHRWVWLKIKRSEGRTAGFGPFPTYQDNPFWYRFLEPQPDVLFACFGRKLDGDPWFTCWFNHLPGPSMSPRSTPMIWIMRECVCVCLCVNRLNQGSAVATSLGAFPSVGCQAGCPQGQRVAQGHLTSFHGGLCT